MDKIYKKHFKVRIILMNYLIKFFSHFMQRKLRAMLVPSLVCFNTLLQFGYDMVHSPPKGRMYSRLVLQLVVLRDGQIMRVLTWSMGYCH